MPKMKTIHQVLDHRNVEPPKATEETLKAISKQTGVNFSHKSYWKAVKHTPFTTLHEAQALMQYFQIDYSELVDMPVSETVENRLS